MSKPSNQIAAIKQPLSACSGCKGVNENLNCVVFLQFCVCRYGRSLMFAWQTEIVFPPHSLLQNLSAFSVRHVHTSGAATKHKIPAPRPLLQANISNTWFA